MILIAITAILILGIAYFQMRQGFFSALLLATWTAIAAGLAVTSYETVAGLATLYAVEPALANPIALLALFVVGVLILRFAGNKLVHGDILFNVNIDRVGGGLCGLITGILSVGVLMLVVQMAPLGRTIIGYSPFTPGLQRDQRLMPFYPDEAVIGFGKILSAGSMSSQRKLAEQHPDLLLEQYCGRNTSELKGRVAAMDEHFRLESIYKLDVDTAKGIWDNLPDALAIHQDAGDDDNVYVVRVSIAKDAAGEDRWWRLPATHFRILAQDIDGKAFDTYPIAYAYWDGTQSLLAREPKKEGDPQPADLIVVRPTSATPTNEDKNKPDANEEDDDEGDDDKKKNKKKKKSDNSSSMLRIDWVYRLPAETTLKECWFRRIAGAPIKPTDIKEGSEYTAALRDDALQTEKLDKD
jgi:hypothetical protein